MKVESEANILQQAEQLAKNKQSSKTTQKNSQGSGYDMNGYQEAN